MVRLKVRFCLLHKNTYVRFNSNMVRLKVYRHVHSICNLLVFQFQYGSIKRPDELSASLQMIGFQFQYGSIKSATMKRLSNGLSAFQFQYGSIKRPAKISEGKIPIMFQFQYGSIKRS